MTGVVPLGSLTWLGIAGATLISEDLTIVAAGLAVGDGRLGLAAALTSCFVGIFLGDVGLWALGRYGGRRVLGVEADREDAADPPARPRPLARRPPGRHLRQPLPPRHAHAALRRVRPPLGRAPGASSSGCSWRWRPGCRSS